MNEQDTITQSDADIENDMINCLSAIIKVQKHKIDRLSAERDKWESAYQESQRQNKILGKALKSEKGDPRNASLDKISPEVAVFSPGARGLSSK